MSTFHGDLLLGGAALRDLDGKLELIPSDDTEHWTGEFSVDPDATSLLEIGRQYLLILDDGRAEKVVVTKIEDDSAQQAAKIRFDGID